MATDDPPALTVHIVTDGVTAGIESWVVSEIQAAAVRAMFGPTDMTSIVSEVALDSSLEMVRSGEIITDAAEKGGRSDGG